MLRGGGIGWDAAALAGTADRLASLLREAGVGPERAAAFLGANSPWQIAAVFACRALGARLVPLNWRLSAEELRWCLAEAEVCCLIEGEHPQRGAVPSATVLDEAALPECLAGRIPLTPSRMDEAAPLLHAYTSGTSGRPKGALLSRAAVAANTSHGIALFEMTPADRVLTVLPLFHVGGLCIQTLPALAAGAEVILHPRFEPEAWFEAIARDRPSLTLLVPAVMAALVSHPRWAGADFSCLRAVGAGSSDVPLALIEAFHAKGVPVQQVYGMTESGPIAIAQTRAEALAAPGSIGRPWGRCKARFGGDGEIQLRGPNLLTGYWRDAAATRAAFTADGWFRTGDAGHVDEAGRFWFTDRLKHLIISGGENIAPAEVERVLASAPGVREGAVVGRPDPRWGEVPVALVVPGEGFSPERVLGHFEGRLARFKHPREVLAVAALPRTALGKLRIEELRRMARNPPKSC